ncbi:MAG: hypothetical protein JJU41_04840 [Bacteroidetes bacterium]|nr:hypothetical protein [Bacteroidota bacterium]
MKTALFTLLLATLVTHLVSAQNNSREVFPEQVSIEHNEAVRSFSGDFVTAHNVGSAQGSTMANMSGMTGNMSFLNILGMMNFVDASQNGNANLFSLTIEGDENTAGITQRGSGNEAQIQLIGNNNTLNTLQHGRSNLLNMNIFSNGLMHNTQQIGNANQIMIQGEQRTPLQIEQRGNGIGIVIEQN